MARIPTPKYGFSIQHLSTSARSIDWDDARGEDGDGVEMILPQPTYGDWEEHAEYLGGRPRPAKREMTDDDAAAFREGRAGAEWEDGFWPIMCYAWPVDLAYGVRVADAVKLMAEHAPACTLIELQGDIAQTFDSQYVIGLSGGGMDLSDNIAAAYLACGCVPPERILIGLSGVVSARQVKAWPLARAYRDAAKYYRGLSKRLTETAKRVASTTRI